MLLGVRNPPPVAQLPLLDNLEVAAPAEEEAESSHLSLEEEIDEFYFEEEVHKAPLIELSDPEEEQDRNSVVGALIIIACSDDSSKAPAQSQTPVLPSVAPQPPSDLSLKVNPDLKKKRPVETPEQGEVVPRLDKQQKTTWGQKNKRASFVESREEENQAEVRVHPRTWSPKLELDGVAIPYNASVQEYNRGRARYIVEALE